ncbi:MAG: PAS domain-containing protein, partial [Maribacter sp.]
ELLLKAEKVARIGGWEVDMLRNEVYWSSATRSIHEVPKNYIPNLEEGIKFYKEGEHRDRITQLVTLSMTNGKPWDTELIIVTAKGNEVWVRTKGEVEIVNGKCIRIFGTFQDIHEKKKAEIRYQEIADRLKIATQNANIGIWEYDILKNTLIWDDNMYNLYGSRKEDFSGDYEAWEAGVHPEDKERGAKEIALAISGKKEFDTEFRVLWPDGTVRNIKAIGNTERNSAGEAIKMTGVNWDITELIHTRLKLERHEESFSKTFKSSTTGMALVSPDGNWIQVNQGLCKSLGYTETELLALTFQEITHPDDLDKDLELLQEVLDNHRDSYQLEKRYFHKDGQTVYSILTVTAVKDIDNNISHFISQIVDITPRKQAEIKFQEIAERLNVATRVANIGIWDYQIEENQVICNDNMYKMYGIPKDSDNLLEEWLKRIHPEDFSEVQENLQTTVALGKPFNTKFRGVKPNGDIIHLIAFGEAQYNSDGQIIKVIGANWDITELLHTKLKLERNKESFLETFENSAIGMALVGPDNKWIKVNKSLSSSLGYSQKELMNLTIQHITHPDDLNKSMDLIEKSYNGEQDSFQIEKRYFHKKGHIIQALLTVTIVRDVYGEVSHSIAQILDLTDRIEAEKRLNTLVNVTKEQNDSLLNFAHIVSHNLRSHSSNMSMLTKFLADEENDKERKKLHIMLINASNSLSETIEHLNKVVQAKTGALEQMQSVSLLNTFEKIEKSIRGLISEQNAASIINIDKSHFVNVVPAYLESILLNLYTNALKYRSPARTPVVEISSSIDKDDVIIAFKDNGQGIDLERHKDKIFGMYKTFHRNKDAKGIGLFITKNQIEAMNGTIAVESEVDKGSTFYIKLIKG